MSRYLIYFLVSIFIVSCASVEKEMAAYESLNNNKASAFVIEANIVTDYSSSYNGSNSKYCTSKSEKKHVLKSITGTTHLKLLFNVQTKKQRILQRLAL